MEQFLGSCSTESKNDILDKNIFIYILVNKRNDTMVWCSTEKLGIAKDSYSVYIITTNCRLDGDCTGTGETQSV